MEEKKPEVEEFLDIEDFDFELSSFGEDVWLVVLSETGEHSMDSATLGVLAKRIKEKRPDVEIVYLSGGIALDCLGDKELALLGLQRIEKGVDC